MNPFRLASIALMLSLLLLTLAPASLTQAQSGVPPDGVTPDAVPIRACEGAGTGGDDASVYGIQFTANQTFSYVEARFTATATGLYTFTAELRRSRGFTGRADALATASLNLLVIDTSPPYHPIRFNFGKITVTGTETFTIKFTSIRGPGKLGFEIFKGGDDRCPNIMETADNTSAAPTERGDPAGFKVLAPDPASFSLDSIYTGTPPRIDGVLDTGEWNYASRLAFDSGFISVVNDAMRLYVLLDLTGDTTADDVNHDTYALTFDADRDGNIDANYDLNYASLPDTGNMRYQFYTGPDAWTTFRTGTYSSRAGGFNCYMADGTLTIVTPMPRHYHCAMHRVWEFAIDLAEIHSEAPGSARMGVQVVSASPRFTNQVPAGFTSSFTNLIRISLASPPEIVDTPRDATVILTARSLEVTQAVQDMDNSLPLVKDKPTVARVFTRTGGVDTPQVAKTYLHGMVGGVDLPGSPLAVMQLAPLTVDRANLTDTANFLLPATWDEGTVTFFGEAAGFHGSESITPDFTLTFAEQRAPTYWIIPLNFGTITAPVLIPQSNIEAQKSYYRAFYPLAHMTFTQKPWTEMDPTDQDHAIIALNGYYDSVELAHSMGAAFTMPEMIFGAAPSGGGSSNPTWSSTGAGRGLVAYGYQGSSMEGTMAHEMNHNLDRSTDGTWGRHAGTLDNNCGAKGPDPEWPYADDHINEIGFDTRLPWSPSGFSLTVIPENVPDLMSYCASGLSSPTKWVSPYRWEHLFETFSPAGIAAEAAAAVAPVYYIYGSVSRGPERGEIAPVLAGPGTPTTNSQQGEYALQLLDASGGILASFPFNAQFIDGPVEPVNTVYFNFRVAPPQVPVAKVLLRHGAAVLDQITVSAHAPTVTVTKPSGGGALSGAQAVEWTASDIDGDALTYFVHYSPDQGATWYPVSGALHHPSLKVDTTRLPGGAGAMFRVTATDGFNNGQGISAVFTLGNNPPIVTINTPEARSAIPTGSVIYLSGEAQDPEGESLPASAYLWMEGGAGIGLGPNVTASLPPGLHTLTLSAVDSQGNVGAVEVTFLVGSRYFLPAVQR